MSEAGILHLIYLAVSLIIYSLNEIFSQSLFSGEQQVLQFNFAAEITASLVSQLKTEPWQEDWYSG